MACAALEALLAKAIWVDLVGSNPPASHIVWLPDEGIIVGPSPHQNSKNISLLLKKLYLIN
jgi:hypothetical protein